MTKKVLLTFLVIWLFSNTGSAQILKNTWIINPQLSGFNLGSTHTEDTGKETFDAFYRQFAHINVLFPAWGLTNFE